MASFADIAPDLERQAIELPSWAFGNSGTRFKVFAQAGVPRDPYEKVADAAQVHLHTGLAPSVALHIPWDRVDDFDKLARHAEDLGVRLGTVNTNTFQDDDYMLGSLCHVDERVRAKAIRHAHRVHRHHGRHGRSRPEGVATRRSQLSRAGRPARPAGAPRRLARARSTHASPTTSGSCSSTSSSNPRSTRPTCPTGAPSFVHCVALGERALVCLDTGHHAPGTNIEFIVMQLLRLGRLGAFDFNSRFYADDDLIVGAADPFQLFRIMFEVVRGGGYDPDSGITFMLDQCHNIEAKIPGQIRSVLNVQEMTARALLVDRRALAEAERAGDVLAGHAVMMDAFSTDVRADLADWRAARDLPPDPMAAYAASGYATRIVAERIGGTPAGWDA